jgi:hypothetical protein
LLVAGAVVRANADDPDPVDALDIARMEVGQLLVLMTSKPGEPVSPINRRIGVACQSENPGAFVGCEVGTGIILATIPFEVRK